MKTHIQVDREVKERLEKLKAKHELASLSAVIKRLLNKCEDKIQ